METAPPRRFWLVELFAYWEGRVTTRQLREFFGISRQQASKDINRYCDLHPKNLDYCKTAKAYLPQENFERFYITPDVTDYLNWMSGQSARSLPQHPSCQLSYTTLNHPPRKVSPEVMRPLIRAMREGRRVEADYGSIANPNREGRIITPHTFVNTGLRWHLRAWCEKNRNYRDFVLSRFHGQPELLDKSNNTSDLDTAWNTEITLILEPDMRLSADQKAVLAHDYGMRNGQLKLHTRATLASYLLKEMQVNTKMLDGRPEAQQLVLVNFDDVREWLF